MVFILRRKYLSVCKNLLRCQISSATSYLLCHHNGKRGGKSCFTKISHGKVANGKESGMLAAVNYFGDNMSMGYSVF